MFESTLVDRGPELLRIMRERDLTAEEQAEFADIRKNCVCRKVSRNRAHADYVSNGENCDFCGRPR